MKKKLFKYLIISMCMASALSMSACGKKKQTAEEYNESIAASRAAAEAEMLALKEQEEERKKQEEKEKFNVKSNEAIAEESRAARQEEVDKIYAEIAENDKIANEGANEEAKNYEIEVAAEDVPEEIAKEVEIIQEMRQETTAPQIDVSEVLEPGEFNKDEFIAQFSSEEQERLIRDKTVINPDGSLTYDIYSMQDGALLVFQDMIYEGDYDETKLDGILEDARSFYSTYPQDVQDTIYKKLTVMWEDHLARQSEWSAEELAENPDKQLYTRAEWEQMQKDLEGWKSIDELYPELAN